MPKNPRYILEGTQGNFDELVLQNSRNGLVAVDFWAPWVGPSLRQRELLIRTAKQFEGRFLLVSVNTDENPRLSSQLNIRSLPVFKLFRHGREIETFHGVQPEADYARIFDRHLGDAAEPAIESALRLWQAGKPNEALRVLAEAAVSMPEEPRYPVLMVKLLMRRQRIDDALAILEALPDELKTHDELSSLHAHLIIMQTGIQSADQNELLTRLESSDDPDVRFQLASSLVIADEYEDALEHLLYLVRHAPDYRDGLPKQCMIALFKLLEGQDEVLNRFRSTLFQLEH